MKSGVSFCFSDAPSSNSLPNLSANGSSLVDTASYICLLVTFSFSTASDPILSRVLRAFIPSLSISIAFRSCMAVLAAMPPPITTPGTAPARKPTPAYFPILTSLYSSTPVSLRAAPYKPP